jgi:competence protein ComEA
VPVARAALGASRTFGTISTHTRDSYVASIGDMELLQHPRVRTIAAAGALLFALVFAARTLLPLAAPRSEGNVAVPASQPVPRGEVVVHVVGGVRRPGLYHLPLGSRIDDAVRRAGGPTRRAETQLVNLAAPLADGQQIVVPVRQPPAARGGGGGTAGEAPSPSGPLHLNTATLEDLDALPGVGPVTAQKILDYRQQHGAFSSVDELDAIPGIGPARLEQLRELVAP